MKKEMVHLQIYVIFLKMFVVSPKVLHTQTDILKILFNWSFIVCDKNTWFPKFKKWRGLTTIF